MSIHWPRKSLSVLGWPLWSTRENGPPRAAFPSDLVRSFSATRKEDGVMEVRNATELDNFCIQRRMNNSSFSNLDREPIRLDSNFVKIRSKTHSLHLLPNYMRAQEQGQAQTIHSLSGNLSRACKWLLSRDLTVWILQLFPDQLSALLQHKNTDNLSLSNTDLQQ